MRQAKLLGLAFAAVFALAGMALSSVASGAAIKILPESGVEKKFTGETDEANPQLVGLFATVTCAKATATGTEEANGKPLGLFHITFSGCKAKFGVNVPCTGLGEAKEVILTLGTWHLVFDQLKPELLAGMLFLPEPVHFECSTVPVTLILVHGELLCLDLEPTSQKTSHLFHCHQKEALQLDKVWWDDKGEGKESTSELKCAVNEGPLEHCAELALGLVLHEAALFADNI
jgi:hypothetical protein